ncbi:O-antigen ligase family protein [Candidatus Daviesbacteria bacterium]|nr:O-antigen ligase family protein [Candidatus Daviesbacteria bacterium]
MLLLILQVITIIVAPLYIVRFRIASVPSTLLELSLLVTILIFGIEVIRSRAKLSDLRTNFDIPIAIMLIATTVAVFVSYNFYGGLGILKAYFIEPILFYYSLVFSIKKFGGKFILWALALTVLWLDGLALLQKLTHNYSLAPNETALDRVTAVYNSANSLALLLGPITLLALALFLIFKGRMRLFWGGIFLVNTLVIVLTKSRGGQLAEISALLVFVYLIYSFTNRFIKKVWYVLPIMLALLVLGYFFYLYDTHNLIPSTSGQPYTRGDTVQIRYFIWAGTVNLLKDHPILGAGLDGFKTLYSNQYRITQYQEEVQYPHNIVLTFWAETGILGLAALVYLCVVYLNRVIGKMYQNKDILFGVGLVAALVYLLVHGLVDVPYFKNDLSLEFWLLFALAEGYLKSKLNLAGK